MLTPLTPVKRVQIVELLVVVLNIALRANFVEFNGTRT